VEILDPAVLAHEHPDEPPVVVVAAEQPIDQAQRSKFDRTLGDGVSFSTFSAA